ncbi:MAG: serine/threonine-protein kinase, partial [Lentisphaerota bacterium]
MANSRVQTGATSPSPADGDHGLSPALDQHRSPEISEQAGSRKYHIANVIGRGGMGVVYEARDLNFQRSVAMKVLAREEKQDPDDVVQFVEEAQITSQLEHPNIIPVHEMGRDDEGNVFYTMKYVKGMTLTDLLNHIRQGDKTSIEQFPLGRLLTIFQKTCDAVAFAHSKSVIHHDLKPGNIMIGDYGEVLVLDWGLAKVLQDQAVKTSLDVPILEGEKSTSSVTIPSSAQQDALNKPIVIDELSVDSIHTDRIGTAFRTAHGRIMGTPAFMAPEQVQPSEQGIDTRTDVYSLGAVLYSILTLRPPMTGENLSDVLRKILNNEIVPPVDFNLPEHPGETSSGKNAIFDLPHCPAGRIPLALSDIVMKSMSGNQDDRYQSVRELQQDVEAYQDGLVWNLVLEEDFSSADVESRWEICGHHETHEGEMRLYGGEPQFLLMKKPLSGDVRIEFECHMESPDLTDLGCFMSAIHSEHTKEIPSSGYQFKYGGYSNSVNVLERSDSKLWSQPA